MSEPNERREVTGMSDHHSTWCAEIDGSHCAAIVSLLERVSALEAQAERLDNPPIVRESDAAYARAQWCAVTDAASRTESEDDTPKGILTDLIAELRDEHEWHFTAMANRAEARLHAITHSDTPTTQPLTPRTDTH
jgi:hypothetical protein